MAVSNSFNQVGVVEPVLFLAFHVSIVMRIIRGQASNKSISYLEAGFKRFKIAFFWRMSEKRIRNKRSLGENYTLR